MTPKQKRMLDLVRDHFAEHGRGPTQRQIRDRLGLKSTGTVNRQLRALEDYGFLRRTKEFSGCYVPVEADELTLHSVPTDALRRELSRRRLLGET